MQGTDNLGKRKRVLCRAISAPSIHLLSKV
jgi:hypothetical protein